VATKPAPFSTGISERRLQENAAKLGEALNAKEASTGKDAGETRVGRGASCCGYDAKQVAKQFEKGASEAKAAVVEKLEDGKVAAERFLKRGRYAVEDCMTETAHTVKRHPSLRLRLPSPPAPPPVSLWASWYLAPPESEKRLRERSLLPDRVYQFAQAASSGFT
jgi:hypothetical protein